MERYILANNTLYDTYDYEAYVEPFEGGAWLQLNNSWIRINSDYKTTNVIEDLIDVGDLIIITETGLVNSKSVHYVWKKTNDCFRTSLGMLAKGFSNMEPNKIEILKPLNNNYFRLCRKEKNKWYID